MNPEVKEFTGKVKKLKTLKTLPKTDNPKAFIQILNSIVFFLQFDNNLFLWDYSVLAACLLALLDALF